MDLDSYMESCKDKKFKWGEFDCCKFASGAIEVATGKNPMEHVSPYNDITTAAIALREHFGSTVVREVFLKVVEEFGAKQVANLPKNGDIACINFEKKFHGKDSVDQQYGLGVFFMGRVYACLQPSGIIRLPFNLAVVDLWRFPKWQV